MLEGDEVFARFQRVERGLLGLKLLGGVVGSLDGQADAPVASVNLNDAGGDFLSHLEHILDLVNALLADLRDVDQPVNLMLQADERAEAGQLGDLAGDQVADLVDLINGLPGVGRELLHADRDALVGLVHFQHDSFDFVALLEDL